MSQFRNFFFKGGGVKGIAYAGAIAVLEGKGILPDCVFIADVLWVPCPAGGGGRRA